jgi:hypothetical protein
LLEAQSKPTVGQFLQSVVRDRRPGQVSAEMFKAVAVTGTHAHVGMHIETGDVCAPFAYDRGLGVLAGASQAQHATASAWTSRDQALHGGIGQMVEGQLLVLVFPRDLPQIARDLPAHGTRQARNVLVAGCGQRMEQHGPIGALCVYAVHRDHVEVNI